MNTSINFNSKGYRKCAARFLGMIDYSTIDNYFEKDRYYCYLNNKDNPGSGYFDLQDVFELDWNWIHKIINKIEQSGKFVFITTSGFSSETKQIKHSVQIFSVDLNIQFTNVKIIDHNRPEIFDSLKRTTMIELLYEFLKWYFKEKINFKE